ncbi:MAG: chitinase [Clostridiales bacterium]|jgi:hypothetical protein|nr:chitinase [Clostridiales bacterium]
MKDNKPKNTVNRDTTSNVRRKYNSTTVSNNPKKWLITISVIVSSIVILSIVLGLALISLNNDVDNINDGGVITTPPTPPGSGAGGGDNGGGETRPPVPPNVDITDFSPDGVEARIRYYLPQSKFEEMFPVRFGTQGWKDHWASQGYPGYWTKDRVESKTDNYYTYDNLIAAARHIATRIHRVQYLQGAEYSVRISVIDKLTNREYIIDPGDGFEAYWNKDKKIVDIKTDYGSFLTSKDDNDNRRELAGWLANNAHEVGEMANIDDKKIYWGLFYNEEVGKEGSTDGAYSQADRPPYEPWPAIPGKSYHGRGPKQVSYNYNYGLLSDVLYTNESYYPAKWGEWNPPDLDTPQGTPPQDANPEHYKTNIWLNNPQILLESGKDAWMSSLLFWLTPQPPKVSCGDVMSRRWMPTQQDYDKYGYESGFAMSIIIINGGVEAGQAELFDNNGDPVNAVARRIMFYKRFAGILNADIQGEQLSVKNMKPWA